MGLIFKQDLPKRVFMPLPPAVSSRGMIQRRLKEAFLGEEGEEMVFRHESANKMKKRFAYNRLKYKNRFV